MPVTARKLVHATPLSTRKDRVARVAKKAKSRSKGDPSTYLSMYFRDMAELDVLRPEEEFTSAREIEALEIMLWETVLSHPGAVERLLDAVATVPDYSTITEATTLRRIAHARDFKAFARAVTR